MSADGFGQGRRTRSIVATLATAGIAAFGGAALQRLRVTRRSGSSGDLDAEILGFPGDAEIPRTKARRKRDAASGIVIGSFQDENDALRAMTTLYRDWPHGFEAYSPQLNEHFFEAMDLPKSPVGLWILAGALFGQFSGWAVTIMLSIYWPHTVANMPVIAIPPFTIIAFEMMVLMAIFGGLFGLMFHGGMPAFSAPAEYMRKFKRNRIGIAMNCHGERQFTEAESMLRELGAEDILRV
jgi:hypothetical protein